MMHSRFQRLKILIFIISVSFLLFSSCRSKRGITNPVDPRFNLLSPKLLGAIADDNNNVILSWRSQNGNPEYMNILRKKINDPVFELIAKQSGLKYTYLDTSNLQEEYSYSLQADWYDRDSPVSNSLSVSFKTTFEREYKLSSHATMGIYGKPTMDGGFILGGTEWLSGDNLEKLIIKTDRYGNQQWAKIFNYQILLNIEETPEGYFIVLFRSYSKSTVIILNENGEVKVKKVYNGFRANFALNFGESTFVIYGISGGKTRLINIDLEGRIIWSKDFYYTYSSGAIDNSHDGGLVFIDLVTERGHTLRLTKTNASGEVEWTKVYSGSYCFSMKSTIDNGFIFLSANSAVKVDASGNGQWSRYLGDSGMEGRSICQTPDGSYISLTSHPRQQRNESIKLVKLRESGEIDWIKYFNGDQSAWGRVVSFTRDNGLMVFGSTNSNTPTAYYIMYLLKVNNLGEFSE